MRKISSNSTISAMQSNHFTDTRCFSSSNRFITMLMLGGTALLDAAIDSLQTYPRPIARPWRILSIRFLPRTGPPEFQRIRERFATHSHLDRSRRTSARPDGLSRGESLQGSTLPWRIPSVLWAVEEERHDHQRRRPARRPHQRVPLCS